MNPRSEQDQIRQLGHPAVRLLLMSMGLAFLGIVVFQLASKGNITYGLVDDTSYRRSSYATVTTGTTLENMFAFGTFGLIGLGCFLVGLRPALLYNKHGVAIYVGLILLAFIGLSITAS